MFPDNLTQEEHEELVQAIIGSQYRLQVTSSSYRLQVTRTIILGVVIFVIFAALLVWMI